ncbi:hypothetical protein O6H91_16G005900 [Diphasiastrum complanatum]|uniref:Uncharacterized protein n=1 Tax=Diphasiastrum complanatum TaxID=34168 RepID=A0ACC2B9J3_DIPCM|nr:hypothetical protein O6H91_16G005900 [Diphasiastrum complanatum]
MGYFFLSCKSSKFEVFVLILLLGSSALGSAKTFQGESCSSVADTCSSFVNYQYPYDLRLQQIANWFSVDPVALFGANNFNLTAAPDPENEIIPGNQTLRIPVTCSCIGQIHRVNSTVYTVKPDDTLSKIADSIYGGLITYQEIAAVNNIADPNKILPGQQFVIPFPCACLNKTYNGHPVISLAYVVSPGDTLSKIAAKAGAQAADISKLNALNNSLLIVGDVLDIPIPACSSSFTTTATDYGLIVASGSYQITADNCVQCSCGSNSTDLYCSPAPALLSGSCPNLHCDGTKLAIGDVKEQALSKSCNVTSCIYEGFQGKTIFSRIHTAEQNTCPAPMHAPLYVPISSAPSSLPPVSAPPPPRPPSPSLQGTAGAPLPTTGAQTPGGPSGPSAPPPSFGFLRHESSDFLVMVATLVCFFSLWF